MDSDPAILFGFDPGLSSVVPNPGHSSMASEPKVLFAALIQGFLLDPVTKGHDAVGEPWYRKVYDRRLCSARSRLRSSAQFLELA